MDGPDLLINKLNLETLKFGQGPRRVSVPAILNSIIVAWIGICLLLSSTDLHVKQDISDESCMQTKYQKNPVKYAAKNGAPSNSSSIEECI